MMDVEDRITAALVPVGLRQQIVHRFGGRICFSAKLRQGDSISLIGQCRHLSLGAVHVRHQSPRQALALANLPLHGIGKLARTPRGPANALWRDPSNKRLHRQRVKGA